MPLRKPTNTQSDAAEAALEAIQEALNIQEASETSAFAPLPVEAHHYEAELTIETVKRIQQKADETLNKEEWVVIDGVDKR